MGNSGHDEVLEIVEDVIHFFSLYWGLLWKFGLDFSWLDVGMYGIFFDVVHEVGDPIDHFVSMFSKLFCVHFLHLDVL